jgi:hypothetical protein
MYIFLGIVGGILILVLFTKLMSRWANKRFISDWKVDDVLTIEGKDKYATLRGWTRTFVIVVFDGADCMNRIEMKEVKNNKSAYWRKMYNDCEKTMGTKPKFNDKGVIYYTNPSKKNGKTENVIDGKNIDLLTETECQVYLKLCLESEDYETAELIKKQMEKYR